jgi:diguanylate cyclase (GGDEF)-like protein
MVWYLAASGALLWTYGIAVLCGAPTGVGEVLTEVALLVGLVAFVIGTLRYRPSSRWSWFAIVALLLNAAGAFMPPGVLAGTATPASAADVAYLLSYGMGGCGLLVIVRRRTPAWSLPALLDAGIITVAAALLTWVYLIDPILAQTQVALPTRLVAAAYLMGDLLSAALGARILLDGGPKSVSIYCLTGYLVCTIVPDTLNTLDALAGTTQWTQLVTGLWLINCLMIGLCGVHPSMRDVDAPSAVVAPDLGPLRLSALAVASLLAPAMLYVQYLRGAPMHVPLACASCALLFLLVIGRLAGLVAIQHRMAVTDMLTGLRSRRYFEDALSGVAQRRGRRSAVLLLDIDHFKLVNDTYGHDGGDRVLREVAHRLSQGVRRGDVPARYGGEEFVVLLPQASPDDARAVADRIHQAITGEPIFVTDDVAITVTVSVGVACLPAEDAGPDQLTLLADQMLYRAKQTGRNRVVVASDVLVAA